MSSQHRWSYPLACPACHTQGEAEVSERAAPPFSDLSRRQYTISEGFRLRAGPITGGVEVVECNACGAAAN